LKIFLDGEDLEQHERSFMVGENAKRCHHFGGQLAFVTELHMSDDQIHQSVS
jgi:hypothetical protein